jgi:hypothetical protein
MRIRFAGVRLLVVLLVMLAATLAGAQSQLLPIATDKTPIALSNHVSVTASRYINQKGDFLYLSGGTSALFFRPAGADAPVRLVQSGDEAPGFPGTLLDQVLGARLNNSGLVAATMEFAQVSGEYQRAIYTWDGASFTKVVGGMDRVYEGQDLLFGRLMTLNAMNDEGDIVFTAPLVPSGVTPDHSTVFLKRRGGPAVRLIGIDDVPDTGGTFTSFSGIQLNNSADVLLIASISGANSGNAFYLFNASGRHLLAAKGVTPCVNAPGNTLFLNNAGLVTFQCDGSVWLHNGSSTKIVAAGTALPSSLGTNAKVASAPNIATRAFNDAGEIIFTANYTVGTSTVPNLGFFRWAPGTSPTFHTVATAGQTAPGTTSYFASNFYGMSINSNGLVTFLSALSTTPVGPTTTYAMFQQDGDALPALVAKDWDSAGSAIGGTLRLGNSTQTRKLDDGTIWTWADIVGGKADYGEFLFKDGPPNVLMSTADELPADARVIMRGFYIQGRGSFVGFPARRTGGETTLAVHDLVANTTNVVVADGDVYAGKPLRISNSSTVFVNSSGQVAFGASVVAATTLGTASGVFVRQPGGPLQKVAVPGDGTSYGTVSSASLSGNSPSTIDDAGAVVFTASFSNGPTRLLVGNADSEPQSIAAVGDAALGGPILSFLMSPLARNASGKVAFLANIGTSAANHRALMFGNGSAAAVVIAEVGYPSPVGGCLYESIGYMAMNNADEVLYTATLKCAGGAPRGGIFLRPAAGGISAIALDGDNAPARAGGCYSIATARPDIGINDGGDIVFRSELADATADSGYFVRRGRSGTVDALVLQGDPAPGTGSVFATVTTSLNSVLAESVQIGDRGDVSFQTRFVNGTSTTVGIWHAKPDNTIEPILIRGTVATEFGGGIEVSSTPGNVWLSEGRYPLVARLAGGTFMDGIFLFVPAAPAPTPAGEAVVTAPVDPTTGTTPITLTFADVSSGGETTVTSAAAGLPTPPDFNLGETPIFYDITTTATFSGPVEVCVDYNSSTFPPGAPPRLLHYENAGWADVTSRFTATQVCGFVTSFSMFTVATVPSLTVALTASPSVLWPPNNKMVTVTVDVTTDTTPTVQLVSITCNEPLGAGDIQGAAFGTDSRRFQLRAARLGQGTGRTYLITYRIAHPSGYSVTKTVTVVVPHDRR